MLGLGVGAWITGAGEITGCCCRICWRCASDGRSGLSGLGVYVDDGWFGVTGAGEITGCCCRICWRGASDERSGRLTGAAGFTTGCAGVVAERNGARGGGLLWRSVLSVLASTGWPGLAASALCLAANGTGGGGGVFLVMTVRFSAAAGGRATLAPPRPASRLSCLGASAGAVPVTGAPATALAGTVTAVRPIGRAVVKSVRETAVTAPGTV